ncbi:MAG: uracil-DNA glycosylase family protein [Gammaproteobacteria bacterium]
MDRRQRHYLQLLGIDIYQRRSLPVDTVSASRPADTPAVPEPQSVPAPADTPALPDRGPPAGTASHTADLPLMTEQPPATPSLAVTRSNTAESGETPPQTPEQAPEQAWAALRQQVEQCTACPLYQTRTQAVFGVGNQNADCMIIGEAPGADEDRLGEPFVGRAGKLLDLMLQAIGLNRADVYIANILKSRPPNNRDPKPTEIEACWPFLVRQIELVQPRLIIAMGRIAAQNLLHLDVPVGRLRGSVHRFEQQIPLIVTYHPAYLLRSPLQKRKSWEDLKLAQRLLRGT